MKKLFLVFLFVFLLSGVLAVDVCCPKTKEGEFYKDIDVGSCNSLCDVSCLATRCSSTSSGKIGCCFDDSEGLCTPQSQKGGCEIDGGLWYDSDACSLDFCNKGCCVIGDEAQYVTERRCEVLSELYGFEKDFNFGGGELDCLLKVEDEKKGACIYEVDVVGGNQIECKFTINKDCFQITGSGEDFYEGLLCTNPDLNTICEKTRETTCVDNKDGVYFLDSCGNIANIYDSSRVNDVSYWSYVKKPEESCGAGTGAIENKNCGNCDYLIGSKCEKGGASYGDYFCKSMNCGKHANGESWCEYDSAIGEGKDAVGSRHWKYYCLDGVVNAEGCEDHRQEICAEKTETGYSGKKITKAQCVKNNWGSCAEAGEGCEANPFCDLKNIFVDEGFFFDVCTPKYPPGFFDLKPEIVSEEEAGARFQGEEIVSGSGMSDSGSEEICGAATQECTVVFLKDPGASLFGGAGSWECEVNCECLEKVFSEQIGEWCYSLGDCGGYINYIGEWTKGGASISSEDESWLLEQGYELPPVIAAAYVGNAEPADESPNLNELKDSGIKGGEGGGVLASKNKGSGSAPKGKFFKRFFTSAMPGGVAGMAIGCVLGPIGCAAGAVIGELIGYFALWDKGDDKEIKILYECMKWEVPPGGEFCEKCNEDPLRICSEYQCSSLGMACELINEGTSKQECYHMNREDTAYPKIFPWPEKISENFKYSNVARNGFRLETENGECLSEGNPVVFGLKTDEPAQCRIDLKPSMGFENMSSYFSGDENVFDYYHLSSINVPNREGLIESLEKENGEQFTEEELSELNSILTDELGNTTLYVRCMDPNGNYNHEAYTIDFCLKPGADLTPPYLAKSVLGNKRYIPYGSTEYNFTIYANEPVDARYSFNDTDYELMEYEMICENDLIKDSNYGLYKCYVNIDNLNNGENKIYIRFKDQPWFEGTVNETNRNVNEESYIYVFYNTENDLEIDKIKPDEDFEISTDYSLIDLRVSTKYGSENGKAVCFYKHQGYWIDFLYTNDDLHEQPDYVVFPGTYEIEVMCEDSAGNIAEDSTKFKVVQDTSSPRVARVFVDGNKIKIITTEEAECVYSMDSCSFSFDSGSKIGLGKEHEIPLKAKTYYVKCKDEHGNVPGGCSIIINGGGSL